MVHVSKHVQYQILEQVQMFVVNLVADECHKLQTELRKNSQRTLFLDIQQELLSLKTQLWELNSFDHFSAEQIFKPFKMILTHDYLTDILAFNTLSSLYLLIKSGIFETKEDSFSVIETLCYCKYQTTSEFDTSRVTNEILMCFSCFLQDQQIKFLSIDSLYLILKFGTTEIEHLQGIMSLPFLLLDTISLLVVYVFKEANNNEFDSLRKETIYSLFYIATSFQSSHSQVAMFAALKLLLTITRIAFLNESISQIEITNKQYNETQKILIACSCVLVSQQLSLSNSRDTFMLSLRIFFNAFQHQCFNLFCCFSPCFSSILDYINSNVPNIVFRSSAFECVSDFVSQNMFTQKLFANTFNRKQTIPLFTKLFNTIVLIAKTPSSIPDSQSLALSLISTITKQLTNFNQTYPKYEPCEEESVERQIEEFESFQKRFNEKPKQFICDSETSLKTGQYSSKDLGKLLFITPGLSCQCIGEFFGNKNQYCLNTLQEYLEYFDFSNIDFDESIRLFLISFKIVGEGQIVDRIFDCFSKQFFATHQNQFSSAESLHVLSYAWLMLHTSFYNQNATKDSFEQFSSMLKGQNNGKDFDQNLLKSLYLSVSRFSVPVEEEHKINSLAYWLLLIQRSDKWKMPLRTKEEVQGLTSKLFSCMWPQISPILSQSFNQSNTSFDEILNPFVEAAKIAAKLDATEVLDSIMSTFCPFATGDITQEKTLTSLQFVAMITREYGTSIREGWRQYIDLLVALFQLDMLNDEMCSQTNICDGNKQIIISPRMAARSQRRESGSILTMFKRIGRSDSDNEILGESQRIKQIIKETGIHQLATQSLRFSHKSLLSLISAFSETAKSMESNPEQNAIYIAFCMHVVCQIASNNSQRIEPLWDNIFSLFKRAFSLAAQMKNGQLLSSLSFNAFFVLIDELWCEDCMKNDLIEALDSVSKLDQNLLKANFGIIDAGLCLFLQHHISTFSILYNWMPILQLISVGIESKTENGVGHIFHLLISKQPQNASGSSSPQSNKNQQNQIQQPPGADKYEEFWAPVLQIAAMLCLSDNEDNYVERFRDFQSLLMFHNVTNITDTIWRDLFEKILFPVMNQLILLAQKKYSSFIPGQKALLMSKILMNTFLFALPQLLPSSAFESMWYRILKSSLDLTKVQDDDVKEAIPEMLSNALRVMRTADVFNSPQRQKMWDVTKQAIEATFPTFLSSFLDETC